MIPVTVAEPPPEPPLVAQSVPLVGHLPHQVVLIRYLQALLVKELYLIEAIDKQIARMRHHDYVRH